MSDLTEHLNAGTLKAVHTAKMTAASVVEGIKVLADPLHLDEIPGAMDKMGWEVSAKLMRRWFAGRPAYVMPSELRGGENGREPIDYAALPSAQMESKIVKMRWLLKFEPVVSVFEDLVRNWNNVLSMDRIRRLLTESAGWAPGRTAALGSGLLHAWELDQRASVNFRTFGQSVSNADFRRWQNKHNTGGDYFVFSNVMWISPHVDYVVL